jgi:hypothetical protein
VRKYSILAPPETATDDRQTCGKGLAEHSTLPARLSELTGAMAENLELHQTTLDLTDENARKEYGAYLKRALAAISAKGA